MLGKAGMACWLACWLTDRVWRDAEGFFVCAALQLDLTVIGNSDCPSGAVVANLGSLRRVLGPPSHSLTCHSWSPAGAVLGWIDDPGRACLWSKLARLWTPETRPSTKTCRGRMPPGHSGLRVSCLRVIGKSICPVNWAQKGIKWNGRAGRQPWGKDRCWRLEQAGWTWSLGQENWALTRSLCQFCPHLGSCQHHVTTGYLLLRNKGTTQMQMTERDRNENEMHIIREEARRQRDEPQSRWPKGLCQNSSRWDGTEYHVKTGGQGVAQGERRRRRVGSRSLPLPSFVALWRCVRCGRILWLMVYFCIWEESTTSLMHLTSGRPQYWKCICCCP